MTNKIEQLKQATKNPIQIRNISIIAHTDHGKTALADSFIAYDGEINPEEAGTKLKLHEHADEEKIGITIDSKTYSFVYTEK